MRNQKSKSIEKWKIEDRMTTVLNFFLVLSCGNRLRQSHNGFQGKKLSCNGLNTKRVFYAIYKDAWSWQ
jgi:hypothetical protein